MLYRILSFLPSFLQHMVVMGGLLSLPQHVHAQAVALEVAATVDERGATSSVGTARQRAYLEAPINQRSKLVEILGDEGTRVFAKAKGWTPIFDGLERAVPQGPDQVYCSADDIGHVMESKGGTSQLGRGYGYVQGSPEWAVESAKYVLRNPKASATEKAAAEFVIRKAAQGKLLVHVVRTKHVLGEPTVAVLEQTTATTAEATRLAKAVLDDFSHATVVGTESVARGATKSAEGGARTASQAVNDAAHSADGALVAAESASGRVLKGVGKLAVPVAVGIDIGVRAKDAADIEKRFAAGEITQQQREVAHAKNTAGMAGGWGGAAGGAWVAGEAGAPLAAMTGPAAPYVEGAVVVVGGVAGYYYGEEGAKHAAEWTVNKVHATGTTISKSATGAWNWTSQKTTSAWQYVFGS